MISFTLDTLSWACFIIGSAFILLGSVGMLRLPDFYTRSHAAGIVDTLGAWLILAGMLLQTTDLISGLKLLLIWALMFFANPTTSHLLIKAAHQSGLKPLLAQGEKDMQP